MLFALIQDGIMRRFLALAAVISCLLSGCATYSSRTVYVGKLHSCNGGGCDFSTTLRLDNGTQKLVRVHVPEHFVMIPTRGKFLLFGSDWDASINGTYLLTLDAYKGGGKDSRVLIDEFLDKTGLITGAASVLDKVYTVKNGVISSKGWIVFNKVGCNERTMLAIHSYSTSHDAVIIAYSIPLVGSIEQTRLRLEDFFKKHVSLAAF